jgi:hypothetical protein
MKDRFVRNGKKPGHYANKAGGKIGSLKEFVTIAASQLHPRI